MKRSLGWLLAAGLLVGCPSVDPGPVEPLLAAREAGPLLTVSSHYDTTSDADPLVAMRRLRELFRRHLVEAYRIRMGEKETSVRKALLNPPGLLRDLEANRFLSAFLRACAEDRWVTFFRDSERTDRVPFRDVVRQALQRAAPIEIDPRRQAFSFPEDMTPQLYTFKQAALRIPGDKVEIGYQSAASQMTLTVRDPTLMAALGEHVGWPARLDPARVAGEESGETVALERKIYVAVGGVAVMEDVIRPGAQVVFDDQGGAVAWVFGTYMREARKDWTESLFRRQSRRVTTRYRIRAEPPPEP